MNLRFTLILILPLFILSGISRAQCPGCMVNTGCTSNPAAPTICPDSLPDGTAMQSYAEDISFYLPAQFVDDGTGFNVTLNQMTVLNVTGLPYGMNWQTNAVNNVYYPSSNPPATEHGCARICGTPLMSGNYTVTVFVRAEVSVSGIGQTVDDNFTLPLRILPSPSSNSSFVISAPTGCVPHTTSFSNLLVSGGNPGYSYLWTFGNGNQSTSEQPPAQNYNAAGDYTVSLQTTIDTIGYFLSSVSVLTATGCNDSPFSAPDYYFKLKDGGTQLYQAPYIDNTDPPVTFSFTPIALNNTIYTLEVWEYDTGLAGDDDDCGTVYFNGHTAGTQTLTSGSLIVTVTVDHPVVVLNATDTIHVFPSPTVSSVSYSPNDSVCSGATIDLMISATNAGLYQWYKDTLAIPGATDSLLAALQSGVYYCEAMNTYGCRLNSNNQGLVFVENPPKPTFWILNNQLNTNLSGYALQWYFDGSPISGANTMVCPVTATGNYFLTATGVFGCMSSSDTVWVVLDNSGTAEIDHQLKARVYPNPGSGVYYLEFDASAGMNICLSVEDLSGRAVYGVDRALYSGNTNLKMDLGELVPGVYILKLEAEGVMYSLKLMKL